MTNFAVITILVVILSFSFVSIYHGFIDFLQAVPIVQHTLTFDRFERNINEMIHSTTHILPGLSPIPTPSYDLVYSNCVMELGFPMKFTLPQRKDRYWSIQIFDPLGRSALTLSSRFFMPQYNHTRDSKIWSLLFHHASDEENLDRTRILDEFDSVFPMPHRYYYVIIRVESVVQNETDFQEALGVQKLITLERIFPETKSEEGKYVPKKRDVQRRDVSTLSLIDLFDIAETIIAANPDSDNPVHLHSHHSKKKIFSSIYMFGAWLSRNMVVKAISSKAVGYISVEKLRTMTTPTFARAIISWKYTYPNDDQEARYYSTFSDMNHQSLHGENIYRLDIPAPPTGAFWSVSVYNADTAQMAPNPQGIYSKGNDLPLGKSLSVYISHIPPSEFVKEGKKVSLNVPFPGYHEEGQNLSVEDINTYYWLPAPAHEFYLVVRIYAPLYESDKDYFPALPMFVAN